jgi:hypothetical protein
VRGHVAIYPHVATTISLAKRTAGQKADVVRNYADAHDSALVTATLPALFSAEADANHLCSIGVRKLRSTENSS